MCGGPTMWAQPPLMYDWCGSPATIAPIPPRLPDTPTPASYTPPSLPSRPAASEEPLSTAGPYEAISCPIVTLASNSSTLAASAATCCARSSIDTFPVLAVGCAEALLRSGVAVGTGQREHRQFGLRLHGFG